MKYRMYSFVLRQLNPMQKGVQTTHAVVEYETFYGKTKEYQTWANVDKTLIVLDGGTYPEMMELLETLGNENIKHGYFTEEDLNNLVTSITVIADERVWDIETYPTFESWILTQEKYLETICYGYNTTRHPTYDEEKRKEAYAEWIEKMGGETNIKLRELISSKRLAQ